MTRLFHLITATFLLIATSCSTTSFIPPPPPPPVPYADSPSPAPLTTVVVRELMVRGRTNWSTAGGKLKSIVLLTKKNANRNKSICEAYQNLPTVAAATSILPGSASVATYWPLLEEPSSSPTCDSLLKGYDFEAASVLLQVYGRPTSKGPVLLIADDKAGAEQRFAFIDLQKADKKQISEIVPGWFRRVSSGGLKDEALRGTSFGSIFGALLCNTGKQIVKDNLPDGADPTSPKTLGYVDSHWHRPSLVSIAGVVFGGTAVELGCQLIHAT